MTLQTISLKAIWPDGVESALTVAIEEPVAQATGDFGCVISLKPDYSSPLCIYGEDAKQALQLAERMCETLINAYFSKGAVVYLENGIPFAGKLRQN